MSTGLIVVQLDGLAEPILRRAIERGEVPTLARWVTSGSHRLVPWECGVSSQTCASQAGILFGHDEDIPGFRWYEKERRRLLVSNHPGDAAEIEHRARNGNGLLRAGGSSLANLLSGEAPSTTLTLSILGGGPVNLRPPDQYLTLLQPFGFWRTLGRAGREVLVEIGEGWRQRWRRVRPRVARGGSYPFLRAASAVILRDATAHFMLLDVRAGVPLIYATFVGYDVVAHHAGPERRDALRVLRQLDAILGRIEAEIATAPRPYRVVVLSDHGQSQGATFRQRHGETLEQVVARLAHIATVEAPRERGEEWGYLSALLSETVQSERRAARAARAYLRPRTRGMYVEVGPDRRRRRPPQSAPVVVCPSGNLANLYFTEHPARASLEWIEATYPGLVEGLLGYDGVGFVLARSETHGSLVLGSGGVRHLAAGRVDGADPLAGYGPRTADHLRRLDGFPHAGDLVVNGRHDALTGETTAFEELVGSHGGFGGLQNQPFLLYPADQPGPDAEIVGAPALHGLLVRWRDGTEDQVGR